MGKTNFGKLGTFLGALLAPGEGLAPHALECDAQVGQLLRGGAGVVRSGQVDNQRPCVGEAVTEDLEKVDLAGWRCSRRHNHRRIRTPPTPTTTTSPTTTR